MFISTYDNKKFNIDSISIDIIDISLSGSYSFKLNKKISKTQYYYEMTGTHVEIGKKIKSLLIGNDDGLECEVHIQGSDGTTPYHIDYGTTLNKGSISNSDGNTDYDALSY